MSIHEFYARTPHTMPLSWQGRLHSASTVEQVVEVVRDFLATVSPYEIARLPEDCRPKRKMVDASDVTEYAFKIVRHHCDDGEGAPRVAQRLASFFTSASIRLSHILAETSGSETDSRQSA